MIRHEAVVVAPAGGLFFVLEQALVGGVSVTVLSE